MRDSLSACEPVILTIAVVFSPWQEPLPVIDAEPGQKTEGNHAVVAVAITEEGDDPEVVIVKNSWGPRWGDQGYGAISRRYLDHYTVAAHRLEV